MIPFFTSLIIFVANLSLENEKFSQRLCKIKILACGEVTILSKIV